MSPPSARPPLVGLTLEDVAGLHDAVVASHRAVAPLVARAAPRPWARTDLEGQRRPLERTSSEPMAEAVAGGNVQARPPFSSVGAWDDEAIRRRHQPLVAATLGDPATGVLSVAGSDFPTQGTPAVGVARQGCAALGTVATGQASVLAGDASARGDPLVDRRRCLPADWVAAASRERRPRGGVPPQTAFQTRTARAWALIDALHERGAVPFGWVTGAEPFGPTPVFLDRMAQAGRWDVMDVPHHVRVWRARPAPAVPPATGRQGPPFTRVRRAPGAPHPVRVDALAPAVPPAAWHAALIHQGSNGPVVAEGACVRAVAVRDGVPGPHVWRVLRRSVREGAAVKASRCNAPAETPAPTLVWLLGRRWPVDQAITQGKDELGLDHDAVRGWVGWHHQLTMTLLAHHCLLRRRCRLGGIAPALTVPHVRVLRAVTLPARPGDAAATLALVREVQRRNAAAARSHRQRPLRRLLDSS